MIRYGVPFGLLFGTHRLQLWDVSVQSKEAEERLDRQYQTVAEWKSHLVNQVRPLWPQFDLRTPDLKQNWNCAVRVSVKWISEFDASAFVSSVSDKIQAAIQPKEPEKHN